MTAPRPVFPAREKVRLLFAHQAYDLKPVFDALEPGIDARQVSTYDDLKAALPEADVLVVSGLWRNALLEHAPQLKYLQSVSSGMNQYDAEGFRDRGILLASGQGVNMNAVSDHAMALILSLTRRLALARDNQAARVWREEQSDPALREEETEGKTLLILGTGRIGDRIARLAKAFGMTVIGVRRDPARGRGAADEMHSLSALGDLIPRADIVVLSCPLTDETRGILSREMLARFRPSAYLINVARGACVDEAALIDSLEGGRIAGAGLDVTTVEPLPPESPLWSMPNVVLTPHTGGETRRYERNVIDILRRNLALLWAGETALVNRVA